MWMEELVYDKGLNEKQLAFRLKPYNHIKKYIDIANPLYIQNLEDSGMSLVYPVVKYANSVVDGINKVQGYKLHVIKGSVNIIKELNNYCWMKDRHEAFTNVPIDKFNHLCVDYQSLVHTTDGVKKICDIQVGDMVYNSGGIFPVLKVFKNGVKEVWDMELTTDDGQKVEISITPNHKIKTTSGWKQAQDIKAGDVIFLAKSSTGRNTTYIMENAISQEEQSICTLQCGNIITVKFQRAITFIIKTVISKIIALITWSVSLLKSIINCICERICKTKSLLINLKIGLTTLESMQTNGTEVKKESSGIESTGEKLLPTCNQKNLHACIAEKSSGKSQLEVTNSALTIVSQRGEESKGLTTKQESVKSAEKNLLLTNTQKQEHVVPCVLASVQVKQKRQSEVYNLMIDEVHEYIANGILVSNCDAFRYSTMADRAGRATKKRYTKDELNFGF
jgi:hypothetical protein